MLNILFNNGSINKWRFLLNHYKLISLSEEQLVLIMLIMNCSSSDKRFITPLEISNHSNFTETQAKAMLDELKQQGFINITMKKGALEMDLSPIFKKIMIIIENNETNLEKQFLYQQVDILLQNPLTNEEKIVLNNYLNNEISDFQLTLILNNYQGKKLVFKELLKLIEGYIKTKPKSLTKYNWLLDN
ncbi:DnaD family protein [Spiroplasma chrysopicola]|uniref:Putative dnad-like replication protein n=1 Tax=Spiroplasma chrysopicola DF-1 TaxID=1276227 RepID=R4UGP2_9MOLU|nr:DnaD family protein [Spiroplasma chrysopicola]AGM25305.1 putative dnad-like replication protein [Spiroplasma chrysopicola DF-1]